MIERHELKYWLAWNRVKDIGPIRFLRLLSRFSSLEEAWNDDFQDKRITGVLHISEKTLVRIRDEKQKINPDNELELLNKTKASVITISEKEYPSLLKDIYDPPPVIYYFGDLIELTRENKGIAIVGSRKGTYYGREIAREIAAELTSRGFVVVSGLARGIDSYAHVGALEGGGKTIAVLGCGIDKIYPAENKTLRNKIIKNGSIISEFPIGTKPEKNNFPRRNRIISGLTMGTLVVEAAQKSGALITADFALDQGREVFAIPGNIHSHLSKGCHDLIIQGAKLVSCYQDILEEFNGGYLPEYKKGEEGNLNYQKSNNTEVSNEYLTDKEKEFLKFISAEPLHIDKIAYLTGKSHSVVSEVLLSLELKNYIQEIEGKRYIRLFKQ